MCRRRGTQKRVPSHGSAACDVRCQWWAIDRHAGRGSLVVGRWSLVVGRGSWVIFSSSSAMRPLFSRESPEGEQPAPAKSSSSLSTLFIIRANTLTFPPIFHFLTREIFSLGGFQGPPATRAGGRPCMMDERRGGGGVCLLFAVCLLAVCMLAADKPRNQGQASDPD